MSHQPHSVKGELLDALELVGFKRIFHTAGSFIRNPRLVLDSLILGDEQFVRPIRFVLAIATPLVIIMSLSNASIGGWLTAAMFDKGIQMDPDPEIRERMVILKDAITTPINLFFGEFRPVIILLITPLLAFIIRLFYRSRKKSVYYFFALLCYTTGISGIIDFTVLLIGSILRLDPNFFALALCSGVGLAAYVLFRTFPESLIFRTLKSAIVSTAIMVVPISLWIPVFVVAWWSARNYKYHLSMTIGEYNFPVNDSLVQANKLHVDSGMYIYDVQPDSPAERFGLETGDVIVKMNNTVITYFLDEKIALDSLKLGDSVDVVVNRAGTDLRYTIPVRPFNEVFPPKKVILGVRGPFIYDSLLHTVFKGGWKVTFVAEDSPAFIAGLRRDDIIVMVDDDSITTRRGRLVARTRLEQKNPGDTAIVTFIRADRLEKVPVKMEKGS